MTDTEFAPEPTDEDLERVGKRLLVLAMKRAGPWVYAAVIFVVLPLLVVWLRGPYKETPYEQALWAACDRGDANACAEADAMLSHGERDE